MRKAVSLVFRVIICIMLGITLFTLAFVIFFMIREALPIFGSVSVRLCQIDAAGVGELVRGGSKEKAS